MALNECIPFYEPGKDLTGHVTKSGGVTGCTFAAMDATGEGHPSTAVSDATSGGNLPVTTPAAGGDTVGVFGHDAAQGKKVKLVRGAGKVVPIKASGAIAAGAEVQTTAAGLAIVLSDGKARGRCWRDATDGSLAMIELYE